LPQRPACANPLDSIPTSATLKGDEGQGNGCESGADGAGAGGDNGVLPGCTRPGSCVWFCRSSIISSIHFATSEKRPDCGFGPVGLVQLLSLLDDDSGATNPPRPFSVEN